MPLAQDVGGARGRDLLVNNNKRCNCSINISNWTLKQDTWMYMVTNVMYYSIAIRLIQSLMHLRGDFRRNDVTSGALPDAPGHDVISCHMTATSSELQPCRAIAV